MTTAQPKPMLAENKRQKLRGTPPSEKRGYVWTSVLYFSSVYLVAAILFLVNSSVIWVAMTPWRESLPTTNQSDQLVQALMLTLPVIALVVEFRVYDLISDRMSDRGLN